MRELITSVDIGLIYGVAAAGVYLTFRTVNFADMTCGTFLSQNSMSRKYA
jgi:ABC-type uncharacterized transport system permease subunit